MKCKHCGSEIDSRNKVHVLPFSMWGYYQCFKCGLVGMLKDIVK